MKTIGWLGVLVGMPAMIAPALSIAQSRSGSSVGKAPADPPMTISALPSCGQGVPAIQFDGPSPPERKKSGVSPGGVDMRSGTLDFSHVDVSIGGEGDAGLSLVRQFSYKDSNYKFRQPFGNFFTHNWDIQIQERRLPKAGACYPSQFDYNETVVYGDLGDNFRKSSSDLDYFRQTAPFGYAELTATQVGNEQPRDFKFVARDGTVIKFNRMSDAACPLFSWRCGFAKTVQRPDGTLYTLSYDTNAAGSDIRLRSVFSSRNFVLLFEYAGEVDRFHQLVKVCAINLATSTASSGGPCPAGVPTATYTYDGAVQTSATDASGNVWAFGRPKAQSFSMTKPGASTAYMTAAYSFVRGGNDDEPSFVIDSQSFSTGEKYNYAWSILENPDGDGSSSRQVLGGGWTDTQGHKLAVEFGSYYQSPPYAGAFPLYFGTPGPEKVTDELGRQTQYVYCEGAQPGGQCIIPPLQRVIDPEGKVEKFRYDGVRNIIELRKIAKPGTGLPDRVETRTFSGTNPVTRAKPTMVADARGNATEYSYDTVHGGVLREVSPPNAAGVRRVKRSAYVSRRAWTMLGAGFLQQPYPVWLLSQERTCRSGGTIDGATGDMMGCAAGAADEIVTTYDYGPDNGSAGNNLLLRGVTVSADQQTRRTCYGYDGNGNRIWETKPRAGATGCY